MLGLSSIQRFFLKKNEYCQGRLKKREGIPSLATNEQFSIQATTYEISATQNDVLKKYTGYSTDSDIIPITVSHCQQNMHEDNYCTRPVVTTTTHVHSNECIIVEDKIKFRKHIYWL